MSVHFSYFSRNNTLLSGSYTNTGRAPYTQLYFGASLDTIKESAYSRFIFDLDLTDLTQKISDGIISTACTGFSGITHTLKMVNTSSFDRAQLRATSFDLNLIRIPLTSGNTGDVQYWDEGIGYDYYDVKKTIKKAIEQPAIIIPKHRILLSQKLNETVALK